MATVKIWTDEEAAADPRVSAVFDDIRATRGTDFINAVWRALANQPDVLQATWAQVKTVMAQPGTLDPLVKEMLYIAVSIANGCTYCVHSHTASARAKGMNDEMYGELLAVVGLASQTNALVTALQVPVDPEFKV